MRASGGEWRLVESVGAVFSPTSDIARDICRAAESARWSVLYPNGQQRWVLELLDGYGATYMTPWPGTTRPVPGSFPSRLARISQHAE